MIKIPPLPFHPRKKLPPLFQQPPLKIEILSNPAPLLKIWLEAKATPHPLLEMGVGGEVGALYELTEF